jgi:cold shock CspA family protein
MEARVKWFNAKAGYGFATLLDDEREVFVHHSGIEVKKEQFRYLVEGEYISLELKECEAHKYQGVKVRGVRGGKLMCETREEAREVRDVRDVREVRVEKKKPRSHKPVLEMQK